MILLKNATSLFSYFPDAMLGFTCDEREHGDIVSV